mgnify:CR=1 FL=1
MIGFRTKVKQLTSGEVQFGQILIADGNSGFTFTDISGLTSGVTTSSSFPLSPTTGALVYRTDVNMLFQYDGGRSKWVTVNEHSLSCGRASVTAGSTTYMRVGDSTHSSTTGFKMKRNGTVLGASVVNNNTLTVSKNIEIRVNNSSVNKSTLTILTGTTGTVATNFNLDFSVNDLIQVVATPSTTGSALDNVIVTIDLAYRI